jgi:very-short-patch-repair endonuclease
MIELLESYLKSRGIELQREFRFHPVRRWRADLYFEAPGMKVAIEIEGGAFSNGRHTRGTGFIKDMEKYNNMTLAGIRLLRFTPQQIQNNMEIAFVENLLDN